ncbi:MAG TPA: HEPN domain-containing protein [Candidatus Brocadiia bacterium]
MNARSKALLRKVSEWIAHGEEDLQLARHALTLKSGCPYRLIAYHAQQCAEKYLKAYLVFHRVDFPYTHNISLLLELCTKHGSWAETLHDAKRLTSFAITTRYPGFDKPVTKAEATRTIDIASYVREVVRDALKQEGFEYH